MPLFTEHLKPTSGNLFRLSDAKDNLPYSRENSKIITEYVLWRIISCSGWLGLGLGLGYIFARDIKVLNSGQNSRELFCKQLDRTYNPFNFFHSKIWIQIQYNCKILCGIFNNYSMSARWI